MTWKKQLDTPYDVAGTVIGYDVDSFGFNFKDQLIHIGYSTLESVNGALQTDKPYTLSGQEFTDFVIRFNELSQTDSGSDALIKTALEFLPGAGTLLNV